MWQSQIASVFGGVYQPAPCYAAPTCHKLVLLPVQVLAENQALVQFKQEVVGRKKSQDAEFVAKQRDALAVSLAFYWQ